MAEPGLEQKLKERILDGYIPETDKLWKHLEKEGKRKDRVACHKSSQMGVVMSVR